jgi:hypothetical protein
MTARELAQQFRARRVAPGKWLAKCPAHSDSRPSLSIREGRKGIMLHCFTGCPTEEILAALDLDFTDLFNDKADGEARLKARKAREREEKRARDQKRMARYLINRARQWESIASRLAERLAYQDNDVVADMFHRSLALARAYNEAIRPIFHPEMRPEVSLYRDSEPPPSDSLLWHAEAVTDERIIASTESRKNTLQHPDREP